MARAGWSRLIPRTDCFQGPDAFRIDAYSEYMPPPRVGWKPYGPVPVNSQLFSLDDPFGWKVHEFDEALELQPGLHQIAKQLLSRLKRLQDGNPETGLPRHISRDNPFWPLELACEKSTQSDRCVLLLPLALSRTQDDKGRVRWTLFGNSEQGPGKAFWKSFFTAPGVEAPPEFGIGFFCRLLQAVYGENVANADGLRRVGLRILPEDKPDFSFWSEGELPSWAKTFLFRGDEPAKVVKYLVTFRQFGRLPAPVRKAYLGGRLPHSRTRCDWRVLANGRLDRALHEDGRLDRTFPFPELRRIASLNAIANSAPKDGFGDQIRRKLERRRHER